MLYSQSIAACLKNSVRTNGVTSRVLETEMESVTKHMCKAKEEKKSGKLRLLSITNETSDLKVINALAKHIRDNFTHLVVLGTGGSTLTGQALVGIKPSFAPMPTRIIFHDNVDPVTTQSLIDHLPFETTCFLVISKSGTTMETLSQFALFYETAKKKLKTTNAETHFVLVTDPTDNPLRRIGKTLGLEILDHDPKIGGRFSIFSNVGLIPAAVAGLNIEDIRKGGKMVLDECEMTRESAPAVGAALNLALMKEGIHTTVLMPYADGLAPFNRWVRQIWSESLGKKGKGTTPIDALGTIDQHSQLQLYLDGPRDKLFTLFFLDHAGKGPKVSTSGFSESSLQYLHGKTVGDIMAAEQEATSATLDNNGCPVRTLALDELNETTIGALAMHFILETVLTAYALGLNPFDQPAVEEGKILAKKSLDAA